MSNISFKAWHKEKQEMFDVLVIDLNVDEVFLDKFSEKAMISGRLEEVHFWVSFSDVVLCQYSGLKDIDDNMVFEGDIVTHVSSHVSFEVFKDRHAFKLRSLNDDLVQEINPDDFYKSLKISGNVFLKKIK